MKPKLNTVYVYRPSEKVMQGMFKKLSAREQEMVVLKGNTPTMIRGYRYAKTVTVNKVSRTLILVLDHKAGNSVNKFFKDVETMVLEYDKIMKIFIKAESKPLDTSIEYEY